MEEAEEEVAEEEENPHFFAFWHNPILLSLFQAHSVANSCFTACTPKEQTSKECGVKNTSA